MKFKQLIRYLPIAFMATSVVLATAVTPPIFTKIDTYNNQSNFNLDIDQRSTEVNNITQIEYIKNDVAKQTGVTDSVASIELVDGSADSWHSAAIVTKTDGSTLLYMWGSNSDGQLGNGTKDDKNIPTPVDTSNFTSPIIKQVSLGWKHSAAVLADGSLYTWGFNNFGQLGNGKFGSETFSPTPVKTSNFTSTIVKQVALGSYHSSALLEDGSLYTWGWNKYGQLGIGNSIDYNRHTPTPVDTSNFASSIKQVVLGSYHSSALLDDGSLYTWGWNNYGQLGIGNSIDYKHTPTPVDTSNFASSIKQVALGKYHSAALLKDGSLYTWGRNNYGQLGNGTNDDKNAPTPVKTSNFTSTIVKQMALADSHSAAILTDGSLYTWGWNEYGQLGDGTNDDKNVPTPIDTSNFTSPIVELTLAQNHSAAILSDNSLYMWGRNGYGELGNGTSNDTDVPTLSNLGKDSHITANPDLTPEQAVNKSWVNGKFDLDGFKQSFNLINVPDVPDQIIDMISKPIPNNKDGSVDIKIYIKYFYNENGLRIHDGTEISLTVTGFVKVSFVDSSITLRTPYMNPTDYGFTAKQLESNLNSAALDAKITLLKKYIDFDLQDQPDGSKARITAISTTPPINKSGELEVTFSLANFYESGSPVNSKSIIIEDLRKTSIIERNSNYATETAKLLTSQFITNLEQQKTPAELETFLKPYLDIDFPVQGSSHNNQATITSAIAKETANPEEIELFIELADYYDETSSELQPNLTFVLDGFIKPSSINIKDDYETIAATTTVRNLIDAFAISTTSQQYMMNLDPYLEFNFNANTKILDVLTTDTTDIDIANGILKFSLVLDNYYEANAQVTSKFFTLEGFIKTSSITKKNKPTSAAQNISAKQLTASIIGDHDNDQYKAILEPFFDFKLATQTLSNKSAVISKVTTSNVDDAQGSLTVEIELQDFYDDNGLVTSLTFNLTGLALSSSIEKTNDADTQAASMTIKNLQDQLVPGSDYQTILTPFLVFNFAAQTAPNVVATISNVTFDNALTNSANGELGIILHLDNYLEDGILVPTKTITLVGFKKVSSITIKTGYKRYAVNTTAKELAKKITTTTTIEQKVIVLNNYLSFQLSDPVLLVIKAINVTNDQELNSGVLAIKIDLNNFFGEDGASVDMLEFSFEGFNHFHFDPKEKPINGLAETPKQVVDSLRLNGSETVIDNNNLNQYVDLSGLTPNSIITINHIEENSDGSITLYLSVDNYYDNDILKKDFKDFTVLLSGLKPADANQSGISWWIYVVIGLGVLLLLIIFIILIKKRKQKEKTIS